MIAPRSERPPDSPGDRDGSGERAPLVSLMGATFDTGNLGVSALASGAIAAVRRAFPRARIFLIDYGRTPAVWTDFVDGKTVTLEFCNLRFSHRVWLPNNIVRLLVLACLIRAVPVAAWRRWLARRNTWLRKIGTADVNLSLAGGDSFSDIYGLRRLLYVALPQILVLLLERPLVLLPQTHGPFTTRFARVIARFILLRARVTYSRDREGLGVVSELIRGNGPRPQLAHDIGFALEPLPPPWEVTERLLSLKRDGPLIGFNVSGLLYIGGYTGGNMFGLKACYAELALALLEHFVTRHGTRVLLVPHVRGDGPNSECDLAACRDLAGRFQGRWAERLHYFEEPFDQHETKQIIGECDFFIGSRMHACIAALSQFVPTVGLAYSRKFSGVMEAAGGGAVVVDLRSLDLEAVLATVDGAWRDRESMRRQLVERVPGIHNALRGLLGGGELQSIIEGSLP